MTKVLLTGASGFIGAHILKRLLHDGHNVVVAVRSLRKGQQILHQYPPETASHLSFVVVEDITKKGAFDKAVQASDAPFTAVIHTASPFYYRPQDPEKDMLQPAIQGTLGILQSVKAYAPLVKRVIVTSSFAAIINFSSHPALYTENVWNPITYEEALNTALTYPGSKKLAEEAAWNFMRTEKPTFTLTTICPPMVYGPVEHHPGSLNDINTSNVIVSDFLQGKFKDQIPPTGFYLWVDVRDVAYAHVQALSAPGVENERFMVVAGHYDNKKMADVIRSAFPHFTAVLPPSDLPGDLPVDIYKFDNSKSVSVLGIKYHSFYDSIKDTAASLQEKFNY
ncbi:hypothetical protein ZTR_10958 [Talaromyces verruculosus]|nr:hypothetical protein ZTR_10958 [Talaromyces verruculosus]